MSGVPVLRCLDIACGYADRVILSGLNLSMCAGQIVAIIGDNASGKTSLFRALLGKQAWLSGSVYWRGQQVPNLRHSTVPPASVAWALQERPIFGGLRLRQALRTTFAPTKATSFSSEMDLLVSEFLGLEKLLDRRMEVLSGGEKAVAWLALTLLNRPALLLLDEPAAGLSAKTQHIATTALTSYAHNHNTACLVIEHRLSLLGRLADEILEMKHFVGSGQIRRHS